MFGYFKKRRQLKALYKILNLWYNACILEINSKDLFEPRPKLGCVCFFIGSIDSVCQSLGFSDETFLEIALNFFKEKTFYKFDDIASSVLLNYFGNNQRVKFAKDNMKIGMDAYRDWYNSSFLSKTPIERFMNLIREWNRKPNLEGDELFLLI
ncbi:MAG: hypothetical protein Q8M94_15000 [Ignavibacteria bacterium]|nr:hypothetical protein [Ignavibacteria bacterium]